MTFTIRAGAITDSARFVANVVGGSGCTSEICMVGVLGCGVR